MQQKIWKRSLALLLAMTLTILSFSACAALTHDPAETPALTQNTPEPEELDEAPVVRAEDDTKKVEPGASWRTVFGDRKLPEEGWIGQRQVAFYFQDEAGEPSVQVLDLPELLDRVDALGQLPRTHYFEQFLDERFSLLLSCFDMAMELGCGKFAFPTSELRARDVSEVVEYLNATFHIYDSRPRFSVTQDLVGEQGERFRFLTVMFTNFDREDLRKHSEALAKARQIVAEIPDGLDEAGRAKYLYRYLCTHVAYNNVDYYEDESWNALYDALVKEYAVCSGYAEGLYCLFDLAGIDCILVDGTVITEKTVAGHAWNLAKLDGSWYLFDATWDHVDSIRQPVYLPRFFGVSQELAEYYGHRVLDPFWAETTPPCNEIYDPDYLFWIPPEFRAGA